MCTSRANICKAVVVVLQGSCGNTQSISVSSKDTPARAQPPLKSPDVLKSSLQLKVHNVSHNSPQCFMLPFGFPFISAQKHVLPVWVNPQNILLFYPQARGAAGRHCGFLSVVPPHPQPHHPRSPPLFLLSFLPHL